jgi:hypothetical protein
LPLFLALTDSTQKAFHDCQNRKKTPVYRCMDLFWLSGICRKNQYTDLHGEEQENAFDIRVVRVQKV